MRRFNPWVVVALFIALAAPLAIPTPAHAVLTGVCSAQADVSGDDGTAFGTITPKTKTGVYTVPIKGPTRACWSASVNLKKVGPTTAL